METLGFHLRLRLKGLSQPTGNYYCGYSGHSNPFSGSALSTEKSSTGGYYTFPYSGYAASHFRIMISMQHGGSVISPISDSDLDREYVQFCLEGPGQSTFSGGSTTCLLNIILWSRLSWLIHKQWNSCLDADATKFMSLCREQ